jgi:hypothetical protein
MKDRKVKQVLSREGTMRKGKVNVEEKYGPCTCIKINNEK